MRSYRTQRGLTLLELLITLVLSVFLAVVIVRASSYEMEEQRQIDTQRATVDQTSAVEKELTQTISGALLDPTLTASTTTGGTTAGGTTTGGTTTGGTTGGGTTGGTTAGGTTGGTDTTTTTESSTSNGPMSYFQSVDEGNAEGGGESRITFTTTVPVPLAAIDNQTDDWPTQQTNYGPIGGPVEISFGMQPIGSPSAGQTGLFERIQHPADADLTQGGTERLLDPDITGIGFQFWDGQEWQPSWDTTTMTTPQLPEAVQVTYRLKSDTGNVDHMFVVPILSSNVNFNNPASTDTTASTTATQ